MLEFTLIIELRNFGFESHWSTLIFFDKTRCEVRFEYVPWKNVWFCFISIVWVHFSHKIEKFDLECHLNTLIFFDLKKNWCLIWTCPVKQCLIWFKLRCLSSFKTKKVTDDFKIYINTLLKILYFKGYKRFLSHNQWVRNAYFGYKCY